MNPNSVQSKDVKGYVYLPRLCSLLPLSPGQWGAWQPPGLRCGPYALHTYRFSARPTSVETGGALPSPYKGRILLLGQDCVMALGACVLDSSPQGAGPGQCCRIPCHPDQGLSAGVHPGTLGPSWRPSSLPGPPGMVQSVSHPQDCALSRLWASRAGLCDFSSSAYGYSAHQAVSRAEH